MSFVKWLFDEEVCRTLPRALAAINITIESIDVDTIKSVGSDENYLIHDTTFKHCRSLYLIIPEAFKQDDIIVLMDAMYRNIKTGQSRKSLDAVTIINFKTIEIE